MGEAGILKPEDRVELINGEIITRSPINRKHIGLVNRLTALFIEMFGRTVVVSPQNSIRIGKHSEPEPDIAILKFREDFYFEKHPMPEDTHLLIEVADSTLKYDSSVKLSLYAEALVQEYWIVNVQSQEIQVFKNPKDKTYQTKEIYKKQQSIKLEQLDALIDVSKIFF